MVSRDSPNSVGKALSEKVPAPDSPLEETPHKARNGELTITCRNRHCPKCQGNARAQWLAARSAELLPVPYFHIVFTLPHELCSLLLQNKRLLYDLLFRTSAASLLELARDPKHLGADIGFLGVLHIWGQNLQIHPHVHYIVPAGGLALDRSRWIDSSRRFFLPVKALSHRFRKKFCQQLWELFQQDRLQFHGSLQQLALTWRLQQLSLATWPKGLGRLRQTTLRRYRTGSQLSGPLHPSRRHLQPSPGGLRERSPILPLARLCPWRQEQDHDSFSRRVPAPLPSPRFAQRPGPHPPLRPVRKPQTGNRPRSLPPVARRSCLRRSPRTNQPAALSRLLRHYAGYRTDDECSTLLSIRPEPPYPTEVPL